MSGLREALESAIETHETGEAANAATETVVGNEGGNTVTPEGTGGGELQVSQPDSHGVADAAESARRARDEKGRFAGKTPVEEAKPGQTPAVATVPGQKAAPTPGTPVEAAKPAPESMKAPQSWKPTAREHWAKVPAEVQAEVSRREREVATALQESAQARKIAADFHAVVSPYAAQIRAEGGNEFSAVGELLQTAQALRTAPAAHKAQLVANIVRQFGIPIQDLDNALAGQATQQQGHQQQPGQFQDPRFDQFIGTLQQVQAQKQAAIRQKASSDVGSFMQQAEFAEDVRQHMSALLSHASQIGQAMSLQEAYDAACWSSKDIRAILQQREAAQSANAGNASTQKARAAASSVRSQPAGVGQPQQTGGLRGDLEAALSKLSGR